MEALEEPVELLKSVRRRWGLSQQDLAAWLDLNRSTIFRWENQSVPIPRIGEYALRFLMMMDDADLGGGER